MGVFVVSPFIMSTVDHKVNHCFGITWKCDSSLY